MPLSGITRTSTYEPELKQLLRTAGSFFPRRKEVAARIPTASPAQKPEMCSEIVYPVVLSLHLCGIAFFGGAILITNLRSMDIFTRLFGDLLVFVYHCFDITRS